MATIEFRVTVEDAAAGPFGLQLAKTPGIIKFDIDWTAGGSLAAPKANGNARQIVMELLMQHQGAPVSLNDIRQAIGGAKSRAYYALDQLRKAGLARSITKGMWALTGKATPDHAKPLLLPKPAAKANGHARKSKRAAPGVAVKVLQSILGEHGPLRRIEIINHLGEHGVSPKSGSGVIQRCRTAGVIRKMPSGQYELTAKGKREATATATEG